MLTRLQRFAESRAAVALILAVFGLSIALQWNGSQSVAVADEVAYVVGGVNLITTGTFTNSFGEPELWFPPVYPVLIGVFSLGGWIDPFVVARALSVIAAVATLLILYRTIERVLQSSEDVDRAREKLTQSPPTLCRWLSALWLPRVLEPVAIRHDTTDTGSVGIESFLAVRLSARCERNQTPDPATGPSASGLRC